MSLIEWQSAYEIGIKTVDEQHQQLVAMINQLEQSVHSRQAEASAQEVIVKLVDYVRYHFAAEERLMGEHNYAQIDQHVRLHQQFVSKVAGFLKQFQTTGAISSQELLSYLKSWLIKHILYEDTKLRILCRSASVSK